MNAAERFGVISLVLVLNPGLWGTTWDVSVARKRGPGAEPWIVRAEQRDSEEQSVEARGSQCEST